MLIRSLALLALVCAVPAAAGSPGPQVHDVGAADVLRKTLLDALRPVVKGRPACKQSCAGAKLTRASIRTAEPSAGARVSRLCEA
ncbi:hypothetical protein [Sphingomonas sanxanigenens]|uniref:UrcA family protein n=1 Tax=Sphingomonas sanxanigenens DSM 19645 = NX02 TaxID=1123269 RepID=W0AIY9_9SPHN|nr:hypothetical protein [Sphingomonas sanxanigenens]AHE56502.1 hypothetical protein NX02_24475 [Sphingomonas sanxanigenens DSM 19645 = NX02]